MTSREKLLRAALRRSMVALRDVMGLAAGLADDDPYFAEKRDASRILLHALSVQHQNRLALRGKK